MKIFKLMMLALVAMVGLNSCSDDCNFIEHDFSQDIVGTWTFLENDLAEAMVIEADGSFLITGVRKGGSLYVETGTITVVNNKVTLAFDTPDGGKEAFEGRLEFVAGKSLSLVLFDDNDVRLTYDYCENDLSDEIVGMWVSTDAPTREGEATIVHTFMDNGKAIYTGFGTYAGEYLVNKETTYNVVGDILFYALPQDNLEEGAPTYITKKLTYAPNGNAFGDLMVQRSKKMVDGKETELTSSMLRVKQSLNLTNKLYAYSSAYVSNAKGADEDFNILGHNFNMANIANGNFDMMFRADLFCVNFPNANTIKLISRPNGQDTVIDIPISVEGNKVTLDMSPVFPACRNVDMYMFQDADDTQLHIYMPTQSFINYFANMEVIALIVEGKLDPTDTVAAEKVYADMEARVESINVSFVMKAIEPAE